MSIAATEITMPDVYRPRRDLDYTIRVASTIEDRLAAWGLVYRVYRRKGYAAPDPRELWYGVHDALPDTTTFLAERDGTPVATLTIVFDSHLGLPADQLYRPELDAMRARGRRMCEVISLVSEEKDLRRGGELVRHMFKLAWITAHHIEGATDFLITVNPRHVSFYRAVILMEERGPERNYEKVEGAPAVLMRLALDRADAIWRKRFRNRPLENNPYVFFTDRVGELSGWLKGMRRPLDQESIRRYFAPHRRPVARKVTEGRVL